MRRAEEQQGCPAQVRQAEEQQGRPGLQERGHPARVRPRPARQEPRRGPRRGGRHRAADDLAEPQLRGLTEVAGLITLLARDRDGEVAAVEHHLGAADAEAVDPILDDLLGLQELLPRRLGAGLGACLQSDTRATLQVDPELWCGPAVAGEEHQCVEHDDDAEERREIAPGTDPARGGCHCFRSLPVDTVRIVSCGRSRSRSRPFSNDGALSSDGGASGAGSAGATGAGGASDHGRLVPPGRGG